MASHLGPNGLQSGSLRNPCTDPEGGGGGGQGARPPMKNHKNIESLCYTGLDPLKYNIAAKQAFNFGPSSAH